jgi:hypothetical protein
VTPTIHVSGGSTSGYKVEISQPPLYLLHSSLPDPKTGKPASIAAVTAEAQALWDKIVGMKLSDITVGTFPTVRLIIRDPTPQELEAMAKEARK